jgi:hypothetical protein
VENHDKGAEKKDRYGAQVAVEPDGSGPEWMKNPGKRISRFLCGDNVGRVLFCGIFCHDESSFPILTESSNPIADTLFEV